MWGMKWLCFVFGLLTIMVQAVNFKGGDASQNVNGTESAKVEAKLPERVEVKELSVDLQDEVLRFWSAVGFTMHSALFTQTPKMDNLLCRNHSRQFLADLRNFKLWATKMFDATAKFPGGILSGAVYHFGDFDECLHVETSVVGRYAIQGKYCLADIKIEPSRETYPSFHIGNGTHLFPHKYDPQGSTWEAIKFANNKLKLRRDVLHWAFCIPSSCTTEDFNVSLNEALKPLGSAFGLHLKADVQDKMCQVKKETTFTTGGIALICVMCFVGIIVGLASLYDVYFFSKRPANEKLSPSTRDRAILCFSAISNGRTILDVKPVPGSIDCIHGIRVCTMFCVIIGHRCLVSFSSPLANAKFVEDSHRGIDRMTLANGSVIVDTFFVLSGTLLAYLFFKGMDKTRKFNVIEYYLHRILRLTPPYIIVILFYVTLLSKIGDGPLWMKEVGKVEEKCSHSWWTNILYISNYVDLKNMCGIQTWYVASDMQLYAVAPLVLYPLWKWPRVGRMVLSAVFILSVMVPFIVTYALKLSPTVLILHRDVLDDVMQDETFLKMYIASYGRAGPYFIGILLGYVLHKIKNKAIKISQKWISLGWILCAVAINSSVFSAYVFYQPGYEYSAFDAALFASLHRIVWALGIAWIVFACVIKQSGPFGPIFSWRVFKPISCLVYSAYLVHGALHIYSVGSMRILDIVDVYKLLWVILADIVASFGLAIPLCLLFEYPIASLEKVLKNGGCKEPRNKKLQTEVNIGSTIMTAELHGIESQNGGLNIPT